MRTRKRYTILAASPHLEGHRYLRSMFARSGLPAGQNRGHRHQNDWYAHESWLWFGISEDGGQSGAQEGDRLHAGRAIVCRSKTSIGLSSR